MVLLFPAVNFGQLQSINFHGDYNNPLSKRFDISEVSGMGGGVKARFNIIGDLSIDLGIGYNYFDVKQDSAVAQWDWRYYSQYMDFVESVLSDTNYTARFKPVQKMDIIPVSLNFNYEIELLNNLSITTSLGGGILFYNRRLYLNEEWKKQFTSIDYTFNYEFRNFAPDRKGNPLFILSGLEIAYSLSELIDINTVAQYNYIIDTGGKFGYKYFPFDDSINLNLGLTIKY